MVVRAIAAMTRYIGVVYAPWFTYIHQAKTELSMSARMIFRAWYCRSVLEGRYSQRIASCDLLSQDAGVVSAWADR